MSITSKQDDSNYISVGSWMGMIFVTAIPVIGLLMILVWAFSGENQSRKNCYRAILSWMLILVVVGVAAGVAIGYLGGAPAIQKFIEDHQNLTQSQ
jgi:F0F1-type ATP synthase membrane subunit c/vacuolar-type H+-ATPase subunit K